MSGNDRPGRPGDEDTDERRLVSDEDYADLMEAEAAKAASRGRLDELDQVARARLWKAIDQKLAADSPGAKAVPAAPPKRPLWAGPLAAAALVVIGLSTYLARPGGEDPSRVKGAEAGVQVRLTLYKLGDAGGEVESFTAEAAAPGTTLLFKAQTPRRAQIGLIVDPGASGGASPSLRLNGDGGPPGQERLFESEGSAFGYRLETGTQPTFCAVAADSAAHVEAVAKDVVAVLGAESGAGGRAAALASLGAACVTVKVMEEP
jgi:hypothetical protein